MFTWKWPLRVLWLLLSAALVLDGVGVATADDGPRNPSEPPLRVGLSRVEITPPVGDAHYRGTSPAVADPLWAKVVYLGQGDYEVINSRVASGSGEMLVEAALQMLGELALPAD